MAMRVSVIIPTFNRAALLPRALKSVLEQAFQDIELIVVDDGSTDDTSRVVSSFADRAGFTVRYHWQENQGRASALNVGMSLTNGDLIHFLDSDDALLAGALEALVATLENESADFVYSPSIEVLESGKEWINYPVAAGRPGNFAVEHFLNSNARPGAILYTSQLLRAIGGYEESLLYNEDSEFLQRVALAGKPAYCSEPTVRVFHHSGSKSRNRIEIYKALLHSSEDILTRYPDFAESLGSSATKRLNQIRCQLVEALIAGGELAEAKLVIRAARIEIPVTTQLALLFHTNFPIRVRKLVNRLRARAAF